MEVVKIVLGGVAGLMIAQAILWWMPWASYRRDPFKLGPKVAKFADWVVPEQFHGKAKPNPAAPGDAGPAAQDLGPWSQQSGDEPFGPPGARLPQRKFINPNETPDDSQQARSAGGPAGRTTKRSKEPSRVEEEPASAASNGVLSDAPRAADAPKIGADVIDASADPLADLELDADLLNMSDPSDEPMVDDPIADDPIIQQTPSGGGPTGDVSSVGRISNAPQVGDAELRTALNETSTILQAWTAAEDVDDRQLIVQSYQALAKLAEAVTFATQMRGEQRQAVSDLLAPLISDPSRRDSLKMIGQRWPAFARREGAGILLVGTVVGTRQEGDLYATELEVAPGEDSVTIYHASDPATACPQGASIAMLGAMVADPDNNVAGYAGGAETLIWTGWTRRIDDN